MAYYTTAPGITFSNGTAAILNTIIHQPTTHIHQPTHSTTQHSTHHPQHNTTNQSSSPTPPQKVKSIDEKSFNVVGRCISKK
jgi:hypothetical protein